MSGSGNILTRPRRKGKYSKLNALRLLPGSPNIDVTTRQCIVLEAQGQKGPCPGWRLLNGQKEAPVVFQEGDHCDRHPV